MQISVIDIVVLAIVLLSAVRGLLRGLSRELADLIRIVGAILLASFFCTPVGTLIFENTRLSESASHIAAYFLILIVSFIILSVIHLLLSKFMHFAFKGIIEKGGGLISGLLKGAVFAVILILLISLWPHDKVRKAVREDSISGHWITEQYPRLYAEISEHYPAIADFHKSLTNNVPDIIKTNMREEDADTSKQSEEISEPADGQN